jgi:ABC-type glutathione transport system ATPase component
VLRGCDRVMVLAHGSFAEQGDFDTLFARPDSACRRILEGA